jgi:hypothetical protein
VQPGAFLLREDHDVSLAHLGLLQRRSPWTARA